MEIKILKDILKDNNHCAQSNSNYLKRKNVKALNIMASPGAGKTNVIIKTIQEMQTQKFYVIEGDIESAIDAQRLNDLGIPVLQINTGGTCHLDANMIGHALKEAQIADDSILIIENVGNLVCTAAFDLGEDFKIVILSVTEGHDKPYKYPLIFEKADVVLLNKIDLLPYVDFSREEFYKGMSVLNEHCPIFELSCKTGEGVDNWISWLKEKVVK